MYYGRGIESGDWYLAAPFDIDPEMLLGAVEEAKREGEQIIFHPHGPVMFRLDWTASDDRYPQDQDGAALMKKILEQIPPQSSS